MCSLTNHTLAKHAIVLLCIQPQKDGLYVPIDLGIGGLAYSEKAVTAELFIVISTRIIQPFISTYFHIPVLENLI
jgi:hypothetical protein